VDKKARFISAIKDNERLIFKVASVYTNNVDDKNDLVQDIVCQLWKAFDSFKGMSSLSTWMYRVGMNVAISQLRASKRKVETVPMEDQILEYREPEAEQEEERWRVFRQQIETLNLLDKGIIMLYLEDKSYDEIAEIIGISKSNVGTKLSRIKDKLKHQISIIQKTDH
jgi:RNA polymerase sigma factor (sigma-70 family)